MRLLAVLVFAVVAACSVAPSTRHVALVGPDGTAHATIVDEVGVVVSASGIFLDARDGWAEGATAPDPLRLELRYAASCDDLTTITIERAGTEEIVVTVGEPRFPPGSRCTPRGFVNHTLTLQLARPIAAENVSVKFEGR
jgi:hypothetical protein